MVAVGRMKDNTMRAENAGVTDLRRRLLAWYDRERRSLPWRAASGARPDPYAVWVSEVMLQQTTVATAGPYYQRFMARWPTVDALAAADLDAVLHAWQGLGYYARARHVHACARTLVEDHGGRFPDSEATLRSLPGIGDYTAAAIAAIAFDRPATPVDGNVFRVVARLFAIDVAPPPGRDLAVRHARRLTPTRRPGDFAQALMDLGSLVCTPRRPRCQACPWAEPCRARRTGSPERFPPPRPKPEKALRRGAVFWLENAAAGVLLRRRPPSGLLGGLMEFPTTEWRQDAWTDGEALAEAPARADWRRLSPPVRHVFSHFRLELTVYTARVADAAAVDGLWWPIDRLDEQALPTAMTKVAALVRTPATGRRRRET